MPVKISKFIHNNKYTIIITMNIIYKALEYYDNQKPHLEKLMSPVKYYKVIKKDTDIERSVIVFYDKKKEEIFRSGFEYVGNYYFNERIWVWAWGILYLQKNQNYLSRKILNYGLDIPYKAQEDNIGFDTSPDIFLKYELTTSRFKIDNHIQLDVHIAICSYLTKIPFIVPIVYNEHESYNTFKYEDIHNTDKGRNSIYIFLLDNTQQTPNIPT